VASLLPAGGPRGRPRPSSPSSPHCAGPSEVVPPAGRPALAPPGIVRSGLRAREAVRGFIGGGAGSLGQSLRSTHQGEGGIEPDGSASQGYSSIPVVKVEGRRVGGTRSKTRWQTQGAARPPARLRLAGRAAPLGRKGPARGGGGGVLCQVAPTLCPAPAESTRGDPLRGESDTSLAVRRLVDADGASLCPLAAPPPRSPHLTSCPDGAPSCPWLPPPIDWARTGHSSG
jgi:hypothetical protein